MFCDNCNSCQSRVGWVGLSVSILVAGFTVFIGIMNHSKALIAVSLCSGIDIASALTVILGLKLANKSIDLEHPYGHGKIEFLVVGGVSALLIVSAIVLLISSAKSIYLHEKGPDQWLTLVAALVVTGVNELKYRHSKCVGLHFNSPAIITMSEHARVDSFSSAAVAIGVLCAKVGLHFIDPLIAIFEIGHIIKASIKMLFASIRNLMDISVPQDVIDTLSDAATEVKGVENVGYIRARQIGQETWVEMSIYVSPDISLHEGRNIADNTRKYIIDKMNYVGNVQVQFLTEKALA